MEDELKMTPAEVELLFWQATASASATAASIVLHEDVKAGKLDHAYAHELLARMGETAVQLVMGTATSVESSMEDFEAGVAKEQSETAVIEH